MPAAKRGEYAFTNGASPPRLTPLQWRSADQLCFALPRDLRWFSATALGVIGFMWLVHMPTSLAYCRGARIALGIFVLVVLPLLIPLTWPTSEALAQAPASRLSVTANYNGFQNNNIVNIAQRRLVFSEKLGNELISHMPTRSKPVRMTGVGNSADQKVATQFEMFLRQNGYHNIQRVDLRALSPPPQGQISVSEAPEGYYLTIAPSAP